MSASAATLSIEDYEKRRIFLNTIKALSKVEQEEIYRIIKDSSAEYSENSNGIFFDVCKLPAHTFERMNQYVEFCKKEQETAKERDEQNRRVHQALLEG